MIMGMVNEREFDTAMITKWISYNQKIIIITKIYSRVNPESASNKSDYNSKFLTYERQNKMRRIQFEVNNMEIHFAMRSIS